MDTLKQFNSVGTLSYLPTLKIKDMKQDYEYPVLNIKTLKTKYGHKFVVELIDEEWNEFQIFLPDRFSKKFNDKDIKELKSVKELKLVYKGTMKCKETNDAYILEFTV